jgi:hypothetical protein
MLYAVEIKRENKLITYLEVNTEKAFDNDSVGQALNHLSLERRKSIMYLDKMYQMIGKTSVVMFVSNTILSGIVIYNYYLDNQTTSTYITNILFMSTKIYDVYSNSTSDENIFYSAYLKTKVQYNDVDPSKFIEFTSIDEDIEKSEHDEPITKNVEEIVVIEAKDPNEIVPLDDDLKELTIEQPIENS